MDSKCLSSSYLMKPCGVEGRGVNCQRTNSRNLLNFYKRNCISKSTTIFPSSNSTLQRWEKVWNSWRTNRLNLERLLFMLSTIHVTTRSMAFWSYCSWPWLTSSRVTSSTTQSISSTNAKDYWCFSSNSSWSSWSSPTWSAKSSSFTLSITTYSAYASA